MPTTPDISTPFTAGDRLDLLPMKLHAVVKGEVLLLKQFTPYESPAYRRYTVVHSSFGNESPYWGLDVATDYTPEGFRTYLGNRGWGGEIYARRHEIQSALFPMLKRIYFDRLEKERA